MKYKLFCKSCLASFIFFMLAAISMDAAFIDKLVPAGMNSKKSGPTTITSDTMDLDMKNNVVTLTGNVIVEDNSNKISANKIDLFLEDSAEPANDNKQAEIKKSNDGDASSSMGSGGKEARIIVATGNVVILNKPTTPEEKAKGDRKAMSGKAEYNLKTGVIILTDKPVIYQGNNYIRGRVITLWRDNDRMKVEGDQSSGQISKLVVESEGDLNPLSQTVTDTQPAASSDQSKEQLGNDIYGK